MSSMSNAVENALADYYFRGMNMPSAATTGYVSLHSSAPGDTGANEITGNNYGRASVALSYSAWESTQQTVVNEASAGTSGQTRNKVTIQFNNPTPAGWGTVTHFGMWSAATNGTFLFGGQLANPKAINAGDNVTFPPDTLVATFA